MRHKTFILVAIIGSLLIFSGFLSGNNLNIYEEEISDNSGIDEEHLKTAGFWEMGPLTIDNTGGGDYTWAEAALEPWCSGSGTWSYPYLIENITMSSSTLLNSLKIANSNVPFIIRNCTFLAGGSNRGGIYLEYSNYGQIINNNGSNTNYNGIHLYYSDFINITGNILNYNGQGIYTYISNHIIISNNTVIGNDNDGILNNQCDEIKVIGNRVIANGQTNIGMYKNGINIAACTNSIISNNTCERNVGNGIYCTSGGNNFTYNRILSNGESGFCLDSVHNIIQGNFIYNNTQNGFLFYDRADHNNVSNNIIKENKARGFYSDDADRWNTYNLFYNNYFIGNQIESIRNGGGRYNLWNNSEIGNYWSDYDGIDANDDGIGDSPYYISAPYGEWDYLPIWYDGPTIIILEPELSSAYGSNSIPPNFSLEINDPNHNATWYQINSYPTKYFINNTGMIDSDIWSVLPDGNIEIKFYANDSYGNINSNNVTITKDTIKPNITINKPSFSNLFSGIAPEFEIYVQDLTLNTTWYSLDNGANNYTFITNGTFSQMAWDNVPSGLFTIIFYANDSFGRETFETIVIEKDAIKPIINIIDPLNNAIYTDKFNPPNFTVEIFDLHLHRIWYIIPGNTQKYFISDNSTINDIAWMNLPEGPLTIRFYVNDTLGNIAYEDVLIVINFIEDVPVISFGNYHIIFMLISLFSLIILMKVKAKHSRSSTL